MRCTTVNPSGLPLNSFILQDSDATSADQPGPSSRRVPLNETPEEKAARKAKEKEVGGCSPTEGLL